MSSEEKSKIAHRCGEERVWWNKLRAAVVRSTFGSENVQNTSAPDRSLQCPCRKNARRCGEMYMFESKC